jgi:hypothetical protein
MGCFVPRHFLPPRLGSSSLSSSSLPFPVSALGLLFWRGGGSESESDGRTFDDGIALCVALAGVRDRGNEAGLQARDVDLPRAATAVVERAVSFPFPRCTPTVGGGTVLMSSSPLSVAESMIAWPSVGGRGLRRAALVTDISLETLVSFC